MAGAHGVVGMLDDALLRPCRGCMKAEGVFGRLLAVGTDLDGIHSPGETVAMFGNFDRDLRKEDPYNDETWHTGDNWQTPVTYGLRGLGGTPRLGVLGDYPWKVFKGGTGLDGIGNIIAFTLLAIGVSWMGSYVARFSADSVEHVARGRRAWRS